MVISNSIDAQSLGAACISVRRFTHRRMQLVKYLVLYKQQSAGEYSIAFIVAPATSRDAQVSDIMMKRGYCNARFFSEPAPRLICEGDVTHLKLLTAEPQTVSVTFFHNYNGKKILKHIKTGNEALKFELLNDDYESFGNGEM